MVDGSVDGVPCTRLLARDCLQILAGGYPYRQQVGFSKSFLKWLAGPINDHLGLSIYHLSDQHLTLNITMQIIVALILALAGVLWLLRRNRGGKPPPGPTPLPLIGNLHLMGSHPHQALHKLSKKYGPIMQVKLGMVRTVVVSSPEAAELFLKTHDTSFAGRPPTEVAEYAYYGGKGIGLSPYSSYWRNARRLVVANLLTTAGMEATARLRKAEFSTMAETLKQSAKSNTITNISEAMKKAFERITYQIIFGEGTRIAHGLQEYVEALLFFAAAFDPARYIPFLRPLDPMGVSRGIRLTSKKLDCALESTIEEYLKDNEDQKDDAKKGFLGKLLSVVNQPMDPKDPTLVLDRDCIKGILIDMLAAALDTSYTAAEWGVSELIRTPRVMKKLQAELDQVVGPARILDESDFPDLYYLDMVVKETMRLHPPGPLLVPHQSIEDVTVNGYFIPKDTQVLVHAWAIGRDPIAWPGKTEEFYPERFEGVDVDIHGRDFRLLPFGSGRRGCPGSRMGMNTVKLVIGLLAHCFDWELPGGVALESLDMTEKFALATPRANHLLALPSYRL